jgi:Lrp/AsnC family transcriptional regulator for asnA, asnC and gidA
MYELDPLDWLIISLLNEDGRMSSAEIARRLEVPARTVNNRIENLVEREIIEIRAVLNPVALGYTVYADVFIEAEPGRVREVVDRVAQFPQVSYVACATGGIDVSVSIRVRSNEELFSFVTDTLGNIPGVRRTSTYLLPFKLKDLESWLPAEAQEVIRSYTHTGFIRKDGDS